MLVRLLKAILNAIIVIVVLGIIVVVLGMVSLLAIASVISPWILPIAILIGALTFFGARR